MALYDVGDKIDLTYLNHRNEVAPKRRKFPNITQAEAEKMMSYLQSLYPQVLA